MQTLHQHHDETNVFYAALIASITGSSKSIAFLLKQKSSQWLWKYNDSYPYDLDDTCVALRAIYMYRPELVTEEVLVGFVRLLVEQESRVGGPYYTWITEDKNTWSDIDIVVNSNIASFLALFNITTPQLQSYFDTCIREGDLSSKYYDSDIVVIYFLSQHYKGERTNILKEVLYRHQNSHGYWNTTLHTAMACTALLRFGENVDTLAAAQKYVAEQYQGKNYTNDPVFIERTTRDSVTYSSCNAYTDACCFEALELLKQNKQAAEQTHSTPEEIFVENTYAVCKSYVSDPLLSQQLAAALEQLSIKDPAHEIQLLPYCFAKCLKPTNAVPDDIVQSLAIANTLGWIGYTMYDKLLDAETDVGMLPLANACIHIMHGIFNEICITDEMKTVVHRILSGIETVTAWEYRYCRIDDADPLPTYGDYKALAHKSLGHALGPILLTLLYDKPEQAAYVEEFFIHYIIARQLNDDAHDWLEDWKRGYVNSVSVDLLKVSKNTETLQKLFWEKHIDVVTKRILEYIKHARTELKKITVISEVTFLEELLLPLERSAHQAILERDKTKRLLEALST